MINKKEVLAIIPARGGSKGIFKKNLKALAGTPLIGYTFKAAKESKLLNRIVLSTDDQEIADFGREEGIEVPGLRPPELAQDDTPMLPVIKYIVEYLEAANKYKPDIIVILQPTSPLRKGRHIDEALQNLISSGADSVVSVVEVPHNFNPYSVMKLEGRELKPFLDYDEKKNLRQLKPKLYARNGAAIYAFTYNCLMNKNSFYGDKCLAYIMKKKESVDIDEPFDLTIADLVIFKETF